MGAAMLGAGLLGAGLNVGGSYLSSVLGGGGKIKGKTATDRRIREQYQTMVKDLRLAGLNPALAYASANPTASATGTSMGGQANLDPSGAAGMGMDAYRRTSKLSFEEQLLDAQREGVEATSAKTRAETVHIEKGIPKANIIEKLWKDVEDIFIGHRQKGVSPKGAHDKVLELFENKPTSARRTNDWQRMRPRDDYERNQRR